MNVQVPGGIAVNESGVVYVSDRKTESAAFHRRLMAFKPKVPGDFTEYEYAGIAADVGEGFGNPLALPVTDAAGHLYVVTDENAIKEYDPANPAAPPICQFNYAAGNIAGMTVDPLSGSVYFYSSSPSKRVHQLSPCDEVSGKFTEVGQSEIKPERSELWGMVFDPLRQFSPSRAPGVLYGAAPGPTPNVGPGEPGQSSLGYIFAPLEESPPVVEAESVFNVGVSSAGLHAVINPEGFQTRYLFQYISAAAYEAGGESFSAAAEAPLGGAVVGEGKADIAVAATVSGLKPDTAYRYRVVASSKCSPGEAEKVCEVPGATQAFHTYPTGGAGLPDHRAYELVSPAEKHGGQVFPINPRVQTCSGGCKLGLGLGRFPIESSSDGEAIAFEGSAFFPGLGAANENEYVARRGGGGWQSANPTPPLLFSRSGEGYKAFAQGFGEAVLEQPAPEGLSPESPPGYDNLYSQSLSSPLALRPLETSQPPNRTAGGSEPFKVKYAGAAADLSRVFFAANDALTGETPVAPEAEDGGGEKFNLYEWERASGKLRLVNVKPANLLTEAGASFGAASANTVSADGRRAFWSDESGQVYVREGAEESVEIPDPGGFLAAATDGSKVLLDNGHIYDLEAETITDLSAGKGAFKGIAGQSDDLSHVYFIDTEVLSGEEENSEGAKAQAGKFNLYAWNQGTTRFVAGLLPDDNDVGVPESVGFRRDWAPVPTERTAKASPQGRYLAFLSTAPLTGFDNTGPGSARCLLAGATFTPGPCAEAFLFDSGTGKLICASCNPGGAAPLGWAQLPLIEGPGSLPQPDFLTDSGRLYFDSGDSLSQFDTNQGAQDVYQWEPGGTGTCTREAGCVALISAGREGIDSNFATADSSGKNVFFTSRERLVAADQDELIDMYDAREFGGFSSESQLPPSECQGEACQALPATPPEPPPASSAFYGPGNVKPTKAKTCKKGQVKKKGRCVAKHRKHKRKHRKHRHRSPSSKHGGQK